jgi:outer membrane biosynthesis protein TonB
LFPLTIKGQNERKNKMRSDYVLYVIAVICFIIAGVFVAGTIPLEATMSLAATAVFFILGIIFAVGGYALRPKVAAPMPMVSQPSPVEPSPPQPEPSPLVEEKVEAPAVPPPVEEAPPPVEEAPVAEPTPPPAEEAAPTEPTPAPTVEEPAKVKEAKPEKKPVRRRRKKKAA